ncbi:glycosyltransferase [Sediminicoccus sp. KRV36]|uniref:glycosyltransferase n=1 Tax=Sediminicoccus sp. KRV36 TaxID=3133721 RepID=UPI00200D9C18|nr:glycosyltransferase [Sediminicoccus rosea]UPY36953.1 glycosyltransferase [Sediminicoccus rosea]
MKSLRDITLPADSADAEMAFRLVLGRWPARASDLEAHLGRSLAEVLLHLLRSAEFRQKVLPRLQGDDTAPQTLLDPDLIAWVAQALGLSGARRWPTALAEWLRHPANLAALAQSEPGLAQALGGTVQRAGAGDWRQTLPHLLCGPAPPLPVTEGNCLAAARQMILSPAWREAVLAPLPGFAAIEAPPEWRALAEAQFLAPGKPPSGQAWAGLLLHLLTDRHSRLRLESALDWFECGAAEEAALPGLIALRDAVSQASAASPSPASSRPPSGHRQVQRALAMAEAGQRGEAIRLLRRLTTETPALAEAWLWLTELLASMDDLPGAHAALAEAARLDPPGDMVPQLAARLALREGQAASGSALPAEGPLRLALGFAPPEILAEALAPTPLALLGAPALQGRAWLLHAALARLPPPPAAPHALLCALARTAAAAGDALAARCFAEAALAQRPDEAETMLLRALAIRQAGDYQGAADALDQLLAAHPTHELAAERRFTFELDLCRADPLRPRARLEELLTQRRVVLHRKLALDPLSPALRLEHARLAIAGGQVAEARALLEALAEARPGWAPPIAALMYLAQDLTDHAGVLAAWARLPAEARGERAVIAAAKAMRLSGGIEAAQALLAEHLPRGDPGILREHARNHFFAGRFAEAALEAQAWLDAPVPDPEFGLLAMAIALEQRAPDAALRHAARLEATGVARSFPIEAPLFRCAALTQAGDWAAGLAALDGMFARYGARPLRRDAGLGGAALDQLRGAGPDPDGLVLDGPKISVVMTSFNSAAYLLTAVRSILEQSYRNLELIIVDDASSDATPALLREIEQRDPRVRVILKTTNDGTYVSKNIGLLHSTGAFVALQDSDDWSHPDRLACSVGMLLRRPDLIGLTTDWLRMTSEGEIIIKAGGQIAHLCCISLIFRRAAVMERIGFFDSVRVAADLEFIQRIGLAFGERAVPRLRWPLLVGRARADSLTASEEFGLGRTGFTTIRSDYHASAEAWHERIRAGEATPRLPFPLGTRRFAAHALILPG